jgi:hypothetical protein
MLACIGINAQSATATLSGTVQDERGAVLAGATVSVVDSARGLKRTALTNQSGGFTVPFLPPSTYTIVVEQTGFGTVQVNDVVVNVNDQRALLIQMKVGEIGVQVDVSNNVSQVNTDGSVGTVVDRQFVQNLPLNGRSFQSLIRLTPGVVMTAATTNSQGQFSVNGQRTNANYFTIDGVGANIGSTPSALPSQSAGGGVPALAATGGTNNLASVDALQEFKIQTSTYAPEFGRSPGAQVSLTTRPGSNIFEGSVYDYFRNDALDANDWFANRNRLRRPPLRQNNFGGVFGGPIFRNRSFFFFSYEGIRLRQPQVASNVTVPSTVARQTAPEALRPFLNAFPIPNGNPDVGNGLAFFNASYSNQIQLDATSIRIDHSFTDKLTVFGRYNYSPSFSITRGGTLSNPTTSRSDTQTLTIGSTFVAKTHVINDLRVNYSTNGVEARYSLDDFGGATPVRESGFFPSYTNPVESLVAVQIGTSLLAYGLNGDSTQKQINIVDTLSVVKGSHQLKFGFDYRRLEPTVGTTKYSILYAFTGISGPGGTAPPGTVMSSTLAAGSQVGHRSGNTYPQFNNFSLFAQDTWNASKRLTLTYGLRWEINPPPTEAEGRSPYTALGLENPATATLSEQGASLWKTSYTNFAPRFGLAYQLFQKPGRETVLRGGAGIFYDLGTSQAANGMGGFPYLRTNFITAGTPFPLTPSQLEPPSHDPNLRPVSVYAFGPDFKMPRTYQWNLAVEQSLGANQTFTAAYVGAAGRELLRMQNYSAPNPTFTSILIVNNSARSDYHAAQLQFQRRLTKGFQALASYTWGKSIDTTSNDSVSLIPSQRIDPDNDRAPSDFDIRHSFNAAATYDIPYPFDNKLGKAILSGWSLDAIFSARSAPPVDVVVTRNIGFGNFSFRPDLVAGVPLYLDDPNVAGGRRINNATVPGSPNQRGPFLVSNELRQGTLGRNALRGFPMQQLDLGLRRRFILTERFDLQLKAEVFNIFNTPNFANPQGSLGTLSAANVLTPNVNFGQSTQMLGRSLSSGGLSAGLNPLYQIGGPRSIQLSLRFGF